MVHVQCVCCRGEVCVCGFSGLLMDEENLNVVVELELMDFSGNCLSEMEKKDVE